MKYPLAIWFTVILFIHISDGLAQGNDWIRFRTVDQKTKKSIPFASVQIKGRNTGVITNADGDFQIPDRFSRYGDTLMISCIGYNTRSVPLRGFDTQIVNTISLQQTSIVLNEVEIVRRKSKRMTAYKVVKMAVLNLPYNSIAEPFSYDAYYRDYQFEDGTYVNLNEALLQVIDSGFQTNDQLRTKITLFDYVENKEFDRDSTREVEYDNQEKKFIPGAQVGTFGGNELMILRIHDPLRNSRQFSFSFIETLNKNFLSNHFFSFGKPTSNNGVELYTINIESKSFVGGDSHLAIGRVYIERGNYAIHKLEYQMYQTKPSKQLLYDVAVEYSRKEKSMHPNYMSVNNLFKMRNPKDFRDTGIFVDPDANSFIVTTNHRVLDNSVTNLSHFELSTDDKKLLILDVRVVNQSEIHILLDKNPGFDIRSPSMVAGVKFKFKGVMDYNGRELNVPSYITINQFREVFIQQTGIPVRYDQTPYVDPMAPLSTQIPVGSDAGSNRWMNTPLRSN